MVTIDIYSDLHIESWARRGWCKGNKTLEEFCSESIQPDEPIANLETLSIAINAGDAGNGRKYEAAVIGALKSKYDKVLSIKGNHDYYGTFYSYYDSFIYEENPIKIVGCTLWSNFRNSAGAGEAAQRGISDFMYIYNLLGWEEMQRWHDADVKFLLDNKDADVVVTHFPPLLQSLHPVYKDSSLNPYFVNDLPDLVKEMNAKLWVHGHTHHQFDYVFENTRVICNASGYAGENIKEPVFKPKRIEI